jgi:hypothetical protein
MFYQSSKPNTITFCVPESPTVKSYITRTIINQTLLAINLLTIVLFQSNVDTRKRSAKRHNKNCNERKINQLTFESPHSILEKRKVITLRKADLTIVIDNWHWLLVGKFRTKKNRNGSDSWHNCMFTAPSFSLDTNVHNKPLYRTHSTSHIQSHYMFRPLTDHHQFGITNKIRIKLHTTAVFLNLCLSLWNQVCVTIHYRGTRSTRRKLASVPLCAPQIPHDLAWRRTRATVVASQRLTTRAMARPW